MALNCLQRLLSSDIRQSYFIFSKFNKISILPSASICSKELRDPNIKKPAPWPYKEKKFTFLRGYIEGTVKRFDENTKIIVVDGNIGAGKSTFAKQLAEAFDMEYFPEPNLDNFYITPYGYDLRELDPIMPPSFKSCDLKTFYANPHHRNVSKFQYRMFILRFNQYIDVLAHVLNTGQGAVLERSVYGDFIFMEAMFKAGYIRKPVRDYYMEIYDRCIEELMQPHLIVYLDISPEVALERIKARNNPIEVNSKVLTKKYLEDIEYQYKQKYLKQMEKHAELLIYDWSNYGDVEVVIEDIERIDFDRFDKYDSKMRDWRKTDDYMWNHFRRLYTNHKLYFMTKLYHDNIEAKELYHPAEEINEYQSILEKVPGEKYAEGFNPQFGESVLFKTRYKSYWHEKIFNFF